MKPTAKTVKVVCSVCDQDWELHKSKAGEDPGLEECVRLLKAALAAKPGVVYSYPYGTTTGVTFPMNQGL